MTDKTEKYLPIVREKLQILGLDPDQIEAAADSICKDAEFLPNELKENSTVFAFDQKIMETARLLGIDKQSFTNAALKQPPLFCQSPQTINGNIEETTRLLGIDKQNFTNAALKQPPLFCRSPQTIAKHADLMRIFNEKSIILEDAQVFYLKNPILLGLSDDNFKLRLAYADHMGLKNQTGFSLLQKSRGKLEAEFVEALGFDNTQKLFIFPKQRDNHFNRIKLVELIDLGLLKSYKYELAPS